jgi:hypothetical protein
MGTEFRVLGGKAQDPLDHGVKCLKEHAGHQVFTHPE